jgi:hypothetical protein
MERVDMDRLDLDASAGFDGLHCLCSQGLFFEVKVSAGSPDRRLEEITMESRRLTWAASVVFVTALGVATGAWAGAGSLDEEQEEGVPYFGFVKDTNGNTVPDARVTAEFKAGGASLITRSDAAGSYNISAFNAETDPNQVTITCSKDGYRYVETVRRNPNLAPGQPVEADCILSK